MKKNNIIHNLIIVVILSFTLSIFFYRNNINEFPSHVHAWTQSDRYAIALRFMDNGFNFFKPATFNLLPNPKMIPTEESGITSVDFPINEYIVALLMKIIGTTDPWVFRIFSLVYGLIGLFFLSLMITKKKNIFYGSFIFIFIYTMPVFTYYLNGFLPTISSISSFIIGLFLYFNYINSHKKKYFFLSIIFLTLSALCRLPFIIPFTAIMLQRIITYIREKKVIKFEIITVTLAYIFFIFYFLYNIFLKNKYGSAFLGDFMPAENIYEAKQILILIYKHWHLQYFTSIHYAFIFFLIGSFIYQIIKIKKFTPFQKLIFEIGSINLIGAFVYSIMMLKQFVNHDYYFYDSFFTVIILFLVFLFSFLPFSKFKKTQVITVIALVAISIPMILFSKSIQKERRVTGDWDRTEITMNNFIGADVFLDSIGIPKKAKILVIDSYTTNAPLILMKRKGYTVITTTEEKIKEALKWKYDYVVIQDCFLLSDVIKNYPKIINYLKRVNGNGKITIYKYLEMPENTTILEFLGLDKQNPVISEKMSFDTIPSCYWQNINSTMELFYSSPSSGILKNNDEYGITFSLEKSDELCERNHKLLFQAKIFTKQDPDKCPCKIVVATDCNDKSLFYQSFDLNSLIKNSNQWEDVTLFFSIPQTTTINNKLSVYFWNYDKSCIYYDDIRINLY